MKAAEQPLNPFRDWLQRTPTVPTAAEIGVSGQTFRNWRSGLTVHRTFHDAVKARALRDGVVVTTDMLITPAAP